MIEGSGKLRRSRLIAAAILVVVFLAGAFAGAAALHVTSARAEAVTTRPPQGDSEGRRGRGEPNPEYMARAMSERLGLTAEQTEAVEEVLDRRQDGAEAILDEMEPRLRRHMEETAAEIRALLTPEQQVEFDRFEEERRGQMDRRRSPNSNRGR